jgi:dTDP-glucose pyrophosphorylase
MMDFRKHFIRDTATIRDALAALDNLRQASLTLFVVNENEQMLGTLTDGDIRRGLLKDIPITHSVSEVMNTSFSYLNVEEFTIDQIQKLRKNKIYLIPFLSREKKISKVVDISQKKSVLPLNGVLMAGGEGRRLRPLTENTPKPLLKVGDKPIIEYNIDHLSLYGVDKIFITIKYLGKQIINYFGDGNNRSLHIRYIEEDQPLGTIGALSLIHEFEYEHILVMNSDILTTIDFEDMFRSAIENNADMVVATSPYEVQIPYGVIETENAQITSLKEKPVYTFFSNAGIYILKKSVLMNIPANSPMNATDLIEKLIEQRRKVVNYPILNYWLDIGKPEDFTKAQADVKHLFA